MPTLVERNSIAQKRATIWELSGGGIKAALTRVSAFEFYRYYVMRRRYYEAAEFHCWR